MAQIINHYQFLYFQKWNIARINIRKEQMENEENRGNRRQPMGEADTDQFFQCHLTSEVKFRDCLLLDNAYITTTSLFDCFS